MGGPGIAVQHAVIVGEVASLAETHDAQRRGNRAPARHEDRPMTSTSTCSQLGAVKASRKGCRTLTRLFGTPCPVAPAMHPSPNQWLGETRQVRVRCEHRRLSRWIQVTPDSSGLD